MKKKTRRIRRKRGKGSSKLYFDASTHDAILRFQKSDSDEERDKIYTSEILPAFDKLAENLIFISGLYKGIDQRVRDELVTDEVSIGDYVLTGGELPSLVILDTVIRLIPKVLNSYESAKTDSFSTELFSSQSIQHLR